MIDAAIRAFSAAGGINALAREIGISPAAVFRWKRRRGIPSHRVLEVERITGISRYELRPDLFGPAPVAGEVA